MNGKVAADGIGGHGIGGHGNAVGNGGLSFGSVIAGKSVDVLAVAARSGWLWLAAGCFWACWDGDGRNLDDELALGVLP